MVSFETSENLKHKIATLEKELSKLKETKKSLKRERDFNSKILQWIDSLVVVIDIKGYILSFNRASEEVSGYRFEEVQDKPFWDILISDEEREDVKSAITDVIEKGLPDKFQNFWVTKDGGKRLIDWVNSILKQPDGSIKYILCTGRDITEQKKAEKALEQSESKYRLLVQHAPAGIYEVDLVEGKITNVNDVMCEYTGYTRKEILQINPLELLTEESQKLFLARHKKISSGKRVPEAVEYEIKCKNNRVLSVLVSTSFHFEDDKLTRATVVAHDITELKTVERALRESSEKYRNLADSLPQIVFETDDSGNITFTNQNALNIMGYAKEDLKKGINALQMIAPEDRDRAMQNIQRVLQGEKVPDAEYNAQRRDGSIFPIIVHSNRIIYDDKPIGLRGIIIDLTERKQADEALRLSEEKFSKAFQASPVWVTITTVREGRFLEVNDTFTKISGFRREEAVGRTSFDLEFWLDPKRDREQAIQLLRKQGYFRNLEMKMRFKDGKDHIMLWSADTISFEGEECLINVLTDITETKIIQEEKASLESQLQQAQKMEAIGTLAGGIAHDFNNILSAIIGYTELSLTEAEKESVLYENLQEIFQASGRAKNLVKQILTFSRQAEQERKPVKVKLICKEAIKFLRASIPTSIKIRQNIGSDSLVIADPTQIHQVLMNLCTNAGHAMEEKGGVLEIKLTDVELSADLLAKFPELNPGSYLELTVSDTGHGIPANIIDRIFDPFFTTKEQGEGTGMGLSVVHGIVGSCGGAIAASSEPGKGSTFNIYLPIVERDNIQPSINENSIADGTERILFVDDESALTNLGKRMLESLGYKVTTRASSIEALELFKAKPDSFDLVITDMTMPNMKGDKLASELIRIRPDIPVIICSGYSAEINPQQAAAMGIRAFVTKPVLKKDIAEAIRKIFDEK